jgi:3D (Asp-Asp-Asp) domain-containing protein
MPALKRANYQLVFLLEAKMDFVIAPNARQHLARIKNLITFKSKTLWMTTVLQTHRLADGVTNIPFAVHRRMTPVRVVVGLAVLAATITPATLYFIEKGRHIDTRLAYRTLSVTSASELSFLRSSVSELIDHQARLTHQLLEAGNTVEADGKVHVRVVATGYSSSVIETDDTPFITATNTRTRNGVLALSRDLLRRFTPGAPFSFGDRVHISGLGYFVVEDVMNARWTQRVDVWFPSRGEAIHFGLRDVVLSRNLEEDRGIVDGMLSERTVTKTAANGL